MKNADRMRDAEYNVRTVVRNDEPRERKRELGVTGRDEYDEYDDVSRRVTESTGAPLFCMRSNPAPTPARPAIAMLLITLGAVKGGVESYLERLAVLLESHVEIYCLCLLPETARSLRSVGVHTMLLPQFGRWTKPLGFLFACFLIPRLTHKHRISIIQLNGLLEAVFLLQARLLRRKAIYTRHGPFEDDLYQWYRQPRRFAPRYIARLFARAASTLICVSEDTHQTLDAALKRKSLVIPHWITPTLAAVRRSFRLRQPPQVVCVCRLEEYKGVQLVIEALKEMAPVHLTVVGDGGFRQILEERARGCDVSFVGYQRAPSTYMNNADLFIMPSLGPEGSSLAALEAMASGVPCILSDLPVYLELTASREAAVHFRCGDVADLAEKIKLVFASETLRASLSRNASLLLKENFAPDKARDAYIQALELTPIQE